MSTFFLSFDDLKWVVAFSYFVYSFGVAYIVPSLFAILSKERDVHEQGKIYGLIDSTDSFALLVALFLVIIYNKNDNISIINYFSFFFFLISRFFYAKFNKTKGLFRG